MLAVLLALVAEEEVVEEEEEVEKEEEEEEEEEESGIAVTAVTPNIFCFNHLLPGQPNRGGSVSLHQSTSSPKL